VWLSKHRPKQVLRQLWNESRPRSHHSLPQMWRANADHDEVLRELWIRIDPRIPDLRKMRYNQSRGHEIL